MIAMMLEDFLDMLDYDVAGMCSSVPEACARVAEGGFDAAILDFNLGGDKVWPVADALDDKGIPFLFATGGDQDDTPTRHALRPSIAKPFTMASVGAALERMFANA